MFNIPFILAYSGSVGHFHVHFFFDNRNSLPNEIWRIHYNFKKEVSIDDITALCYRMKQSVFEYIISFCRPETREVIDVKCGTSCTRLVREFGSLSTKTNKPKVFLEKVPKSEAEIPSEAYPSRIETWNISDQFLFMIYELYLKRNIKQGGVEFKHNNYDEFVKKLLSTPLPDGRHRCTWGILVPFFAVKNSNEAEAVEKIWSWVENSKKLRETDVSRRMVEYWLDRARKRGIKPFRFETMKQIMGDVPEFLSLLGGADEKES
jgi:hypothetical protein